MSRPAPSEPVPGKDGAATAGALQRSAFVSLRSAHSDAWARIREGQRRMPQLFATIAGELRSVCARLARRLTSGAARLAVLNRMRAATVDWEAAAAAVCTENNVERSRLDDDRIR